MVKQVDDLFDVNRISRGKIKLKKENAELVKILNHAIGTTRPLLDSLDQELIITIHEEPLYFYCDPIRLAQVFTNLLNNASKFTPKGGKVWITSQRNNDELIISVRDNGIGISELDQQYIFEMFVQLDKSLERTSNGLGLGLSLVKSLVEQHDGVVQVLSGGSGCGSEFVVKLPILTLAVSEGSDKSSDIAQNATSPLRILVADDNRDSAASLALLLELMGHQIEVAYDGLDAVNKADTFCPDVILLDIGMPELNGYDAARRIRDVRKEGYKLVALTGMSKEEDRQLSMQAGFDAHLVKPVDLGSLKEFLTKD
jgi:CheY-like chemotaxis protein